MCKRERHTQIDGIPRTNEKQDEELLEKEKKKDDKGHLKTIRKKSDWTNFNTTQRLMWRRRETRWLVYRCLPSPSRLIDWKFQKQKKKRPSPSGWNPGRIQSDFDAQVLPLYTPHTSLNEPNACFIIVYTYTLSPITVCVSSTILNSFFPSFPWWWWWWWQNNDSSTSLSYFLDRQQVLLFPLSHSLFLFHSTHLPFFFRTQWIFAITFISAHPSVIKEKSRQRAHLQGAPFYHLLTHSA